MAFDLPVSELGLQFGSGAVIGGLIGFAAKKVAKIIAILVGLELALFTFLESKGLISVKWDQLTAGLVGAGSGAAGAAPTSTLTAFLSTLSVSAGFTGGFYLGFRKG
jgi:uncharacterized membrane protein (Fun14 family)